MILLQIIGDELFCSIVDQWRSLCLISSRDSKRFLWSLISNIAWAGNISGIIFMEMIEFIIKNSFSLWDGRVLTYAKDCLSSEALNYLYGSLMTDLEVSWDIIAWTTDVM